MASQCPRCGAARGTGRFCSSCAYDYWGAASGAAQQPPLQQEPLGKSQPKPAHPELPGARHPRSLQRSQSSLSRSLGFSG